MTAIIEREYGGFVVLTQAELTELEGEIETAAWYTTAVASVARRDKALLIGRYVEAGKPNLNRHVFRAEDLSSAKASLIGAPLNINHHQRHVVGTYLGAEVMYPVNADGDPGNGDGDPSMLPNAATTPPPPPPRRQAALGAQPWMETLAAVWKKIMPDEYNSMRKVQSEGGLTQSMEALPEAIQCDGADGCGRQFPYDGVISAQYCEHLNAGRSNKLLINPYFVGGGVIMPPVKPGWPDARVNMASMSDAAVAAMRASIDEMVAKVQEALPHLAAGQIEQISQILIQPTQAEIEDTELSKSMDELAKVKAALLAEYGWAEIMWARTFTMEMRMKLAKQGMAMPDGSYPIVTVGDLKNAIQAIGRAKPGKRGAVVSFIKRRAKALGVPKLAENLAAEAESEADARKRKAKTAPKTPPQMPPMKMPMNTPMSMPNADDAAKKGASKKAC